MPTNILNNLNTDQKKAASAIEGPVLILAGAGSGKTRVLTYRVCHMIADCGIHPSNILMCTFTNKAAGEMRTRVTSLLAEIDFESNSFMPFAGTFHSLCAQILRSSGSSIGISPYYVIYDTTDQKATIRDIMKTLDISTRNINPNAVLHTISSLKNELLTAKDYQQFARGYFQEAVVDIYRAYETTLRNSNALDFDDLLSFTVRLFQTNPAILKSYQEKFQYLLIDEYQDTNKAQYTLTKLLGGDKKNICVVGDASQSIYKFRGADFRNIINFKKDFPNTREFNLEQNYRSTQNVLDAAYGVISKNTTHPILKLWTDKPKGEKITLYEARNEHDEAKFITQSILQSTYPYDEIAILYRTNAQSRIIEENFLHAGIAYILVGGTRFYERREIKDVLAYLRVLANEKDTTSIKRLLKIGKRRYAKFESLAETIRSENLLLSYTTLELMDKILEATEYLSLFDTNIEEDRSRLENIKELRSVATEYPELLQFLQNVSLMEQNEKPKKRTNSKQNAVTLMTIHSAKGLEFSVVYLVGMEEGLFPHSRTLMDAEELEEERRLCYVALTRAKQQLYLTHANKRLFFGTRTENMASRFIADIPEHTLRQQTSLRADHGFSSNDLLL